MRDAGFPEPPMSLGSAANVQTMRPPVKDTDLKRIEAHLKRTFNTGGIIVKARPKQNDSAEVYVGDEFIGIVFEDEDEEGSFMFEMAILAEDLPAYSPTDLTARRECAGRFSSQRVGAARSRPYSASTMSSAFCWTSCWASWMPRL